MTKGTPYHCKWCGKTVKRKNSKKWIKSYCEKSGKTVHLQRTTDPHTGLAIGDKGFAFSANRS